jgi:hypothetical protein
MYGSACWTASVAIKLFALYWWKILEDLSSLSLSATCDKENTFSYVYLSFSLNGGGRKEKIAASSHTYVHILHSLTQSHAQTVNI